MLPCGDLSGLRLAFDPGAGRPRATSALAPPSETDAKLAHKLG
jgi:hypothetical protein